MKKNSGTGFGKTILFGEHFVVYGLPGIVAALEHQIDVSVKEKNDFPHSFIDETKKFSGVPKISWGQAEKTVKRILEFLKIKKPLEIKVSGNLPVPRSGIGSSAAKCVALVRALNNFFDLNMTEEEINLAAHEGEKEIHGNPSGIDDTAATYGGIFWFERKKTKNLIQNFKIKKPIEIVLVESGKKTSAREVIAALKELKERKKDFVTKIFQEYEKLVIKAYDALIEYDLKKVGALMNKNHELLKKLTISCDELEKVTTIAREAGALGAKLTGAGRGGLAIALTPGKKLQKKVSAALSNAGFDVLETKIG
jgi:mevalonate kinase